MATLKNSFTAGRLIHTYIVSALRQAAFRLDLDIELNPIRKGWLEIDYIMKVEGPKDKILTFKNWAETYFSEIAK